MPPPKSASVSSVRNGAIETPGGCRSGVIGQLQHPVAVRPPGSSGQEVARRLYDVGNRTQTPQADLERARRRQVYGVTGIPSRDCIDRVKLSQVGHRHRPDVLVSSGVLSLEGMDGANLSSKLRNASVSGKVSFSTRIGMSRRWSIGSET